MAPRPCSLAATTIWCRAQCSTPSSGSEDQWATRAARILTIKAECHMEQRTEATRTPRMRTRRSFLPNEQDLSLQTSKNQDLSSLRSPYRSGIHTPAWRPSPCCPPPRGDGGGGHCGRPRPNLKILIYQIIRRVDTSTPRPSHWLGDRATNILRLSLTG